MFPASDLLVKAEMDYRRERLIAARPPKRVRRRRGQRGLRSRRPAQRSQRVSVA